VVRDERRRALFCACLNKMTAAVALRRGNVTRKSKTVECIGRPLQVRDLNGGFWRFLKREEIPPRSEVAFIASEPFTILGIDPRDRVDDIKTTALENSAKWEALLAEGDMTKPDAVSMLGHIRHASEILAEDCIIYRSFAAQFNKSFSHFNSKAVQSTILKAILKLCPSLLRRDTYYRLKQGGLFSSSVLMSLMLLFTVAAVPIGGAFGGALFATTILAQLGPLAIIPIIALLALGAVAATMYRKHRSVINELRPHLRVHILNIEALARAVEDRLLLKSFDAYRIGATPNYRAFREETSKTMTVIIQRVISRWIDRVGVLLEKEEGGTTPDRFIELLRDNTQIVLEAMDRVVADEMDKLAGSGIHQIEGKA
jgi:hypothetical protein